MRVFDLFSHLLNKKEVTKKIKHKWVNDEVVNYYCHNFLGKKDIKHCENNLRRKCSHFFSSYFCDYLFDTKSNDTSLRRK